MQKLVDAEARRRCGCAGRSRSLPPAQFRRSTRPRRRARGRLRTSRSDRRRRAARCQRQGRALRSRGGRPYRAGRQRDGQPAAPGARVRRHATRPARRGAARIERPFAPVEVSSAQAPVHQVVLTGSEADFTRLPVHLQHGEDGGPYISAAIDITRSFERQDRNVGYRRLMLRGPTEAGVDLTAPSDLRVKYDGVRQAQGAHADRVRDRLAPDRQRGRGVHVDRRRRGRHHGRHARRAGAAGAVRDHRRHGRPPTPRSCSRAISTSVAGASRRAPTASSWATTAG